MNETYEILTRTHQNRDVRLYRLGPGHLPKMLLLGGIHGDEPEGSLIVEDFIEQARNKVSEFKCCVLAIPNYNADGLEYNLRTNSKGVDLNRNLPSKDWSAVHKAARYFPGPHPNSEPETKALIALLAQDKPFLVIHCHTYEPQICYTGERSKKWALKLAKNFDHPITDDIGYPTPGSLGQYCHLNLEIPCLCLELPEQVERKKAWSLVGEALLEIACGGP